MLLRLLKETRGRKAMECKELKMLSMEKDTDSGSFLKPPFSAE